MLAMQSWSGMVLQREPEEHIALRSAHTPVAALLLECSRGQPQPGDLHLANGTPAGRGWLPTCEARFSYV